MQKMRIEERDEFNLLIEVITNLGFKKKHDERNYDILYRNIIFSKGSSELVIDIDRNAAVITLSSEKYSGLIRQIPSITIKDDDLETFISNIDYISKFL